MSALPTAAAATNPYLAIGGAFAEGLGSAIGGAGGPSNAANRGESIFDSSGWNINFGAGSIESSRAQAGQLSEYMPYILAGAAVLIVWRLTRRKK